MRHRKQNIPVSYTACTVSLPVLTTPTVGGAGRTVRSNVHVHRICDTIKFDEVLSYRSRALLADVQCLVSPNKLTALYVHDASANVLL